MKLSRIFPSVRRLEQDYGRVCNERRQLAFTNMQRAITTATLEDLLSLCEQRKVNFGKMTLKDAEIILTTLVDYRRTIEMLGAPDPGWSRVKEVFDKYDIKEVKEIPTPWHPNSQR